MSPQSAFLRTVVERRFLHQCSDLERLDAALSAGKPLTAYVGFDCTGPSLHVGHLLSIMLLRWFQKSGHRPIALMGGGTTKVGDPSGKDESRQLLSDETIAANMASIKGVFEKFLKFGDGPTDALMVDNATWLDRLQYIPFLREYGRHFSVNRMLSFDSVKLRLEREQPLSFLEFNYMILQAYDFVELFKRHGCALQMGGSDQWGNILNGVELGRRVADAELFALTSPLITTSSGAKMGKTAAGAVWLSADRVSPYDYWQFWRNTEDGDVGRFLRLFTEMPEDEIRRLEALKDADINEAKKALANAATSLLHGETAAREAAETARKTFEQGGAGDALPTVEIARSELGAGIPAFELLHRAGLAASKGEARRTIKGGGGYLNDKPIASEVQTVTLADLDAQGLLKLAAGKKRHALVRAV
jgi:tyrosyl-tRNA synthetase